MRNHYLYILSVACLLGLTACENLLSPPSTDNSDRNLNVGTNAVLVALREEQGAWDVRTAANVGFAPSSNSLIMTDENSRFSVIIACPSNDRAAPHRMYFYLGTTKELGDINHQCRKSEANIARHRVYGSINGIDVNQNQKARLALGSNQGDWVYEAFAFEDVAGVYDILGYSIKENPDGTTTPLHLLKKPLVTLDDNPPARSNIDFSLTGQTLNFTSDIPQSAFAQASVSGLPSDATWNSQVSFRSAGNTQLIMAEGALSPLSYFGFPLYSEGTGSLVRLQGDGEGHDFTSHIYNSQQQVISSVSHFFKEPHDVSMQFAQGALSIGGVTPEQHDDGISINANWNVASDSSYGDANLYYWIIKGSTAIVPLCDSCGGVDSRKLEWHIIATPGWLSSQTNTMALSLPPVTDLSDYWSRSWNFSISSALEWELQAFFTSVDREVNPDSTDLDLEALLNYLFNRQYVNGLTYAQLIGRSS
jgi:hypothetical protein